MLDPSFEVGGSNFKEIRLITVLRNVVCIDRPMLQVSGESIGFRKARAPTSLSNCFILNKPPKKRTQHYLHAITSLDLPNTNFPFNFNLKPLNIRSASAAVSSLTEFFSAMDIEAVGLQEDFRVQ
ncbi:hypothetical protein CEXT_134641 [Caerostris extrusa]|uniref:Uncharacterized protein n=1 Tax=Caerostris extrusa TaxID=172846 RepID=A0AAV4SXI0_CAEEX|nr:hypothetical protein CEXT_134641 [Caerostris extrusa]